MADVHPIAPKKGAYTGQSSAVVAMMNRSCTSADRSNVASSQAFVRYTRDTERYLHDAAERGRAGGPCGIDRKTRLLWKAA